ncbi:UvrY/SirA/GacA family response regulator transcription factor [Kangiella koreensis]|uniref:Two component transcriptional regulator, LuxR family n=1 Tax=Kangiella koreensis (strain DSM 16069 / JCM 12317 / KCTC 12182 / SW-125) TaxID=523791 RepID=C7RAS3_KANKD|nr:UvrY/SirA/GacA family response regulator transcription factor [Kangiella koreensis]ACV26365.1 two component transcriptional regulator, LuxR family [Kangiella koreensis DSM 16069]
MIKVLLVDDHDLVRMGLGRLLSDADGIEVVGEAESGEEAIKKVKELNPHVVMMDANMPGIGGLEATRRMLRFEPDLKVIALTVHGSEPYPTQFIAAGAMGYLTKGTDINEMVKAIHSVNRGKLYLAAEVAQQMALSQFSKTEDNPFSTLSEREMQIMLMITRGEKVQSISDKLHLSPKTVNSYRYRLFEKLGVENDVSLTHMALRYKVIESQ